MAVTMGIAEVSVPRFYECDGCGKHLDADSEETQEMLHWEHRGAYTSIFGDGENISLPKMCAAPPGTVDPATGKCLLP